MSPEQEMKQQHTCIAHARITAQSIFQQTGNSNPEIPTVRMATGQKVCASSRGRKGPTSTSYADDTWGRDQERLGGYAAECARLITRSQRTNIDELYGRYVGQ
jgi:hypothetical protein